MRKFAISDIHGCQKSFVALLQKIDFTTTDELYLLGDYINRGPDSKGVIDLIWELQRTGHVVHCLRGNHEQMLLDLYRSDYSPYNHINEQLLASFGINHVKDIPAEYISWMNDLEYYLEVDDYLLVHAGFNFNIPDPLSDREAMLWIRNWRTDIDRRWLNGRIVVHGHTPIQRAAILHYLQHAEHTPEIFIDNGCAFHQVTELGNLCALDLQARRMTFQPYLG